MELEGYKAFYRILSGLFTHWSSDPLIIFNIQLIENYIYRK